MKRYLTLSRANEATDLFTMRYAGWRIRQRLLPQVVLQLEEVIQLGVNRPTTYAISARTTRIVTCS